MQRKAKVAERRERRLQEKNLFDNDVVERRKREDSSNDLSTEGEDFDYSYYYYGEGDDYEVYVGGKSCPPPRVRPRMPNLKSFIQTMIMNLIKSIQTTKTMTHRAMEFRYINSVFRIPGQ